MKFLLDTHCWLWLQTEPQRFAAYLLETLADPSSQRYLSAASAWEIAIKYAIGKLPLPDDPTVYVPDRMRISQVQGLPITPSHALAVAAPPPRHLDPFDRLLVAQAQMEDMTLITADAVFERYDVRMIHPKSV